jgi:arylsulfate sulfotransferase
VKRRHCPAAEPACGLRPAVLVLFAGLLVLCQSCGSSSGGGSEKSTTSQILEATVQATTNPLVAKYSVTIASPGSVIVEFGQDQSYPYKTSAQLVPTAGGTATLLVAGMKANSPYHLRAIVTFSDGSQQVDSDHVFQTGTIPPQRIPTMKVTTTAETSPAPGVELMSLTVGNANQLLALATDPAGNVIWYYDYDASLGIPQPIKLLPNGHMLLVLYLEGSPGGTVQEIDLAGNVISQFDYKQLSQKLKNAGYNINVFSIDHDFVLLPNGHLLLVITDTRTFTDLPGCPGQTAVNGSAIVDLDANRNPVWVWDAFDHLDVNRHPMSFPDWTHANALVYSQDDGNLLFSLRHQSWVLKIDYNNGDGAGDIIWKLGYQGDFILSSGQIFDWFYAQHDPNIMSPNSTGNFQLAMFDNGDDRPIDQSGTPCGTPVPEVCYSTAAIFQVDENARTASRWWSFTTPYSWWGGNVRELPNSDMFVDQTAPLDLNLTGSRIQEVTPSPHPTVIWQMEIDNQNSYRTIHLPSLYPDVQW